MNRKQVLAAAGFLGLMIIVHFISGIKINASILSETSKKDFIQDSGEINILFCPHEHCESALLSFLDSSQQSIHCALYEINLPSVQQKLKEKAGKIDVKIVTDNDYYKKFSAPFVKADASGLMHNKFCVLDGKKIFTGSMNPTANDAHKNNNNLLLIESTLLARNYEQEFQELWNGIFKKGERTNTPAIRLDKIEIKNYFCPEDYCSERIKQELKKAEKSIYFMTFSFTHESIANILLLKYHDGLEVKGVMETQQIDDDSQFQRLQFQGIDVIRDKNKYKLHHKVFIIDEETVITGSFNPSNNADKRNDENVLIIKDKKIAQKFIDEFRGLIR